MNNYILKLSNIKCYDLTLKKENHNNNNINIDPYVKYSMDEFKKSKTETISKSITPQFKYEKIVQTTLNRNDLVRKMFQIECWDSCIMGDNFIGSSQLDFFTILNGPVHHKLVLRNQGIANGTVEFDLEMCELTQVKLTFGNLKASYYAGSLPFSSIDQSIEKYLFYYILNQSKIQKITKTLKTKKSTDLFWQDTSLDQIIFTTSLKDLLVSPIVFNVLQYKTYNGETDPSLGQITITLSNIVFDPSHITGPAYGGVDQKKIQFVEPIIHQNQVVGIMEGEIYFDNVSEYIQMQDAVHTETGIQSLNGTQISIPQQQQTLPTVQQQQIPQKTSQQIPQQIPQQTPQQTPYAPQQIPQQIPQQTPQQTPYAPPASQQIPQQTPQQTPYAPQTPQQTSYQPQPQAPPSVPTVNNVQPSQQQQQSSKYQGLEYKDPRLPEGWVIREDPTGKKYYCDHNTKQTYWTLPPNIAALLQSPLPVNPQSQQPKPTTPLQPLQPVQQQGYVYPQQVQQPGYAYPQQQQQVAYQQYPYVQQQSGYVYPQYFQQYPAGSYVVSYGSNSHCHGRHHHC
ncbi:hypothetical protein DICPUDRAFT_81110 [Dictyostelium purpureum]|uniref:WW domain-containing protein n=1 Tax=Dictyostelium purpureum TaxID=5786 RepID=F0ZSI3_DICPU|nr:uncharacterized protein DICPUDRAFT_81110 [Dictyostelium purpureum]EGC33108.1 hypothetical protein DICPUDRAFT_81110 [Dictyostelium purpureum]|eukprot:XP_003290385.1 hypothetical protein DICPUDRAFT_81110 [Dictyostelium purpureum]